MSGAYTDIRGALVSRLKTLPGLPSGVVWDNVPFTPTLGSAYYRVALLPAEPSQAALGDDGANEQTGIFQVSLCFPAGTGTKALQGAIDALCSHFKRGTQLVYNTQEVRVTKTWAGNLMQETDWVVIPVSIRYYAQTPN